MIIKLQTGKDNKILRTKSKRVADFGDQELKKFIDNMTETLNSMKDVGIGLAAPQVGKNIRLFILSPEISSNHLVFINPKLSKSFKKSLLNEGCLSLPVLYGNVKRSVSATITAFDENGQKFKIKATGILAHALQHEVDHLDGVLFIDKAKEVFEIKNR